MSTRDVDHSNPTGLLATHNTFTCVSGVLTGSDVYCAAVSPLALPSSLLTLETSRDNHMSTTSTTTAMSFETPRMYMMQPNRNRRNVRATSPCSQHKLLHALGLRSPEHSLHFPHDKLSVAITVAHAAGAAFRLRITKPHHARGNDIHKVPVSFRQIVCFHLAVSKDKHVGGIDGAYFRQPIEAVPQRRVESCSCAEELFLTIRTIQKATSRPKRRRHVQHAGIGNLGFALAVGDRALGCEGSRGYPRCCCQSIAVHHSDLQVGAMERCETVYWRTWIWRRINNEVGALDSMLCSRTCP